jgi:hypothetical protein
MLHGAQHGAKHRRGPADQITEEKLTRGFDIRRGSQKTTRTWTSPAPGAGETKKTLSSLFVTFDASHARARGQTAGKRSQEWPKAGRLGHWQGIMSRPLQNAPTGAPKAADKS